MPETVTESTPDEVAEVEEETVTESAPADEVIEEVNVEKDVY